MSAGGYCTAPRPVGRRWRSLRTRTTASGKSCVRSRWMAWRTLEAGREAPLGVTKLFAGL